MIGKKYHDETVVELMVVNLSDGSYIFIDRKSTNEYSVIRRQNKTLHPLSDYRKVIVLRITIIKFKIWVFLKYDVKKLIIFLSSGK